MTRLLSSVTSVVFVTTLFVAATWLNTSIDGRPVPDPSPIQVASLDKAPRL